MAELAAVMASAHAPQLIAPPPTEDPEQVRLTLEAMGQLGRRLDEVQPDALLLIAGDHLEGFFLNCVAPFTVFLAEQASGTFAGRHWSYPVATELALALVEEGLEAGFDLAYSQEAELETPLLKVKPSQVVRQSNIWFSIEAGEGLLPEAVDYVGDGHFIYASDIPHWDNEFPKSLHEVIDHPGLSIETKEKILHRNAAELFALKTRVPA